MRSAHTTTGAVRTFFALLAAFLTAFPLPSAAQQAADAQHTAAARALFEEGVRLADTEQWQDAADRFRRSLALRASPVVAYNLASALVRLGVLVEASELLGEIARDEEAPAAARSAAAQLAEEVRPRIGRLTIHLDGYPMEAEVKLNGRVLLPELIGVAIPADPGTAEVKVSRGDEVVAEGTAEIAEGGSAEIRLDVPPPPVVATVSEPTFRPGDVLRGQEATFAPGDILLRGAIPEPPPPEPEPEPPPPEPEPAPVRQPTPRPAPPPPASTNLLESPWFWLAAAGLLAVGAIGAVILIKQSE